MNLPKLIAGVVASLLGTLIWYLASPADTPGQSNADLALLRTPVTVTLTGGRVVKGELHGTDSLCADWTSALQANPDTRVTLPNGAALTGNGVLSVTVDHTQLSGLKAMGNVSACPDTLTVLPAGSAASSMDVLTNTAGSVVDMKRALNDLTGP